MLLLLELPRTPAPQRHGAPTHCPQREGARAWEARPHSLQGSHRVLSPAYNRRRRPRRVRLARTTAGAECWCAALPPQLKAQMEAEKSAVLEARLEDARANAGGGEESLVPAAADAASSPTVRVRERAHTTMPTHPHTRCTHAHTGGRRG
jgi:hypothetical protein